MRSSSSKRFSLEPSILLALAIGVLGALSIAFATTNGLILTTDTAYYFASARSLISGHGLVHSIDSTELVPLTQFAPLYPIVLAALGTSTADLLICNRWLVVILYCATILTSAAVVHRCTRGSGPATVTSAFAVGLSTPVLQAHVMAASDALFLFFWVLALALVGRAIDTRRPTAIAISGVTLALALLTRYAGVSLLATACLGLLLFERSPWSTRLRRAFTVGALGAAPLAIWLIRNQLLTGNTTNRGMAFHPVHLGHFSDGLFAVSRWLIPIPIPARARVATLAVIAALVGLGALI